MKRRLFSVVLALAAALSLVVVAPATESHAGVCSMYQYRLKNKAVVYETRPGGWMYPDGWAYTGYYFNVGAHEIKWFSASGYYTGTLFNADKERLRTYTTIHKSNLDYVTCWGEPRQS